MPRSPGWSEEGFPFPAERGELPRSQRPCQGLGPGSKAGVMSVQAAGRGRRALTAGVWTPAPPSSPCSLPCRLQAALQQQRVCLRQSHLQGWPLLQASLGPGPGGWGGHLWGPAELSPGSASAAQQPGPWSKLSEFRSLGNFMGISNPSCQPSGGCVVVCVKQPPERLEDPPVHPALVWLCSAPGSGASCHTEPTVQGGRGGDAEG